MCVEGPSIARCEPMQNFVTKSTLDARPQPKIFCLRNSRLLDVNYKRAGKFDFDFHSLIRSFLSFRLSDRHEIVTTAQ